MFIDVNPGFINVIAPGGGSGYFFSALLTKIMLEEILSINHIPFDDQNFDSDFVFKTNQVNEYNHDGFAPLCTNFHHDYAHSHFYSHGAKNQDEVVEFLKPYINFFVICSDKETFKFCRIMHIAKHEWRDCDGDIDKFKSIILNDHNRKAIEQSNFVFEHGSDNFSENPQGFFSPTTQLANELQKISRDRNIVIDFKDLFFDRDADLIKKICGTIKCKSRYPLMDEKIEEYTNKNIELHKTILEIIGE